MELLLQVALLTAMSRLLWVGWSGPRFERSLRGESRSEVLWLAALAAIAVIRFRYGWPADTPWSLMGVMTLLLTAGLAWACNVSYRWIHEMPPRARRAMDLANGLPAIRRMIRCWTWVTLTLFLSGPPLSLTWYAALLLVCATLVAWWSRVSHLLRLARRTLQFGQTPWDSSVAEFDVFLSYRRIHANMVRWVAEELIRRGVCVWFDEYMIRARDRGLVTQRLQHGVSISRAMAVFADDTYADSEWCCNSELEPYLAKHGAGQVIPIQMTTGRAFVDRYGERLANCRWKRANLTELADDQVQELVTHILREVGTDPAAGNLSDAFPDAGERVRVLAKGCMVSMVLPGFTWSHPEHDGAAGGSGFYCFIHRGVPLYAEFSSGCATGPLRAAVPVEHQLEDTVLMEQTRDFASAYLEEHGYRDIGVHTVVTQGFRHFAISYWNTSSGTWSRKYSITLPLPGTSQNLETVVTFTHFGSFIDFLCSAPLMERIISTIRLEVEDGTRWNVPAGTSAPVH